MGVVDLFARQDDGGWMMDLPPPPPQEYLDETYAPQLLAVDGTMYGLAMLCVLLRIYVRVVMLKTFGLDDWVMVFAAALSTTIFAMFVTLTKIGLGHHAEYFTYVRMDMFMPLFKILWWYAWLVVIAYSAIKISIALFLLRLADHRRKWRWVLYGIIVVLVLFTIGSVLSLILQCRPIAAAWDFSLRPPAGNAVCYDQDIYRNTGVFNSVFNLVSDLILALLPIPMVWKLQTNIRTRISLCIVLGLGLFACATAVYKIPLQYNFFDEPDFSGKGAWYYIWQQLEMNVGIIAACLPTLKPLAADFFGAVSALTSGGRYGQGSKPGTNGGSRPFVSNGYLKQQERSATASYAMGEMRGSAGRSHPDSPYDEDFKEGTITYVKRRGSQSGQSDESVLPLHRTHGGILRTTEVEVR